MLISAARSWVRIGGVVQLVQSPVLTPAKRALLGLAPVGELAHGQATVFWRVPVTEAGYVAHLVGTHVLDVKGTSGTGRRPEVAGVEGHAEAGDPFGLGVEACGRSSQHAAVPVGTTPADCIRLSGARIELSRRVIANEAPGGDGLVQRRDRRRDGGLELRGDADECVLDDIAGIEPLDAVVYQLELVGLGGGVLSGSGVGLTVLVDRPTGEHRTRPSGQAG